MYASPNIIRVIKSRRMTWKVHVACMGEMRNAYNILVGKLEGKRPLGSPKRRWEDNIRMDLSEIVWEGVRFGLDASVSGLEPVAGCEHGNGPSGSIKGGEFDSDSLHKDLLPWNQSIIILCNLYIPLSL
jgi:hypothetical protein